MVAPLAPADADVIEAGGAHVGGVVQVAPVEDDRRAQAALQLVESPGCGIPAIR